MATDVQRIQFDFVSRGAREVTRDIERVGDQAEQSSQALESTGGRGGKAMSGLTAGIGKAAGALGALGLGLAGISAALSKGLDAQAATAKMQAQLGLTKDQSERIGHDAGKIYAQAYGESMDEVKGAITSVIRNMDGMRDASSEALQSTTKHAMDLATVMDEDVGRVTVAVSQLIRNGLVKNATEGFDLLTKSTQMGINKSEDLLDTVNEYSTIFREVGISGPKAFGLIGQAIKAGARDADTAADAIKEFAIRSKDGSASSIAAFKTLGFNAKQMTAAFAAGGPGADRAFKQVIDRLKAMKDPVKQNATAVALFGTKAEDLGKALFALDPTTAVKGLGNLAGATDRAGTALGDTAKAKLTAFKRGLELHVTNFIGDKVIPSLETLGAAVQNWGKSKDGQKTLAALRNGLKSVSDWIRVKLVPALREMGVWFEKKIWPVIYKFNKEILQELIRQLKGIGKELTGSGVNWRMLAKVIGKVVEVVYKGLAPVLTVLWKVTFKALGFWIRWSIKSYVFLYDAVVRAIKIFQRSQKVLKSWGLDFNKIVTTVTSFAVKSFITITKVFLTLVTSLVRGAAKAFGWVPGLGGKLKDAAKKVEAFRDEVNKQIAKITAGKTVSIKVKALAGGVVDAGSAAARAAFGRAFGGPISGPGTGTSDDVPMWWGSHGEHVWTAKEVEAVGGHQKMFQLRAMAKKGMLQLAGGGPVGMSVKTVASPVGPPFQRIFDGIGAILVRFATKLASMFGGSTAVVRAARSMIGYPYSWGGGDRNGPGYGIDRGSGTFGFDCSGLTEYAWWKGAHVGIGGTTVPQWANSRPISGPRPGALAFPRGPEVHVMLGSDKRGYVIQAPFTGSFVQEVPRSSGNWRWPTGAKGYYAGGPVKRLGDAVTQGLATASQSQLARTLGIAGRAFGGPVMRNTPYLVGERGPEIYTPGRSGQISPVGSTIVHVHIHGSALASKREIADEVLSSLRHASKNGVNVRVTGSM